MLLSKKTQTYSVIAFVQSLNSETLFSQLGIRRKQSEGAFGEQGSKQTILDTATEDSTQSGISHRSNPGAKNKICRSYQQRNRDT